MDRSLNIFCCALSAGLAFAASAAAQEPPEAGAVRVAAFNAHLTRGEAGAVAADIAAGGPQVAAVVEIIHRVQPDVLLINELDHDPEGAALAALQTALAKRGLDYPHAFLAPSNTGEPTGLDVNGDGEVSGPADAFGWGEFEGRYAMAVLSRLPILSEEARTFQSFRWADMPGNLIPPGHYAAEVEPVLRLSSKSHWDLPVRLPNGAVAHLLASHPTPPVFDGPEDANGRRNHDEIRFWRDYIDGHDYIYDDAGVYGGLAEGALFVIAGDLNSDPADGASLQQGIRDLLAHPRVQDPEPTSEGGREASEVQGGLNQEHQGDPALDTADWRDTGRYASGNLRVDYVLPSTGLEVVGAFVFWPEAADPLHDLVADNLSSDHRLVAVDVRPVE